MPPRNAKPVIKANQAGLVSLSASAAQKGGDLITDIAHHGRRLDERRHHPRWTGGKGCRQLAMLRGEAPLGMRGQGVSECGRLDIR